MPCQLRSETVMSLKWIADRLRMGAWPHDEANSESLCEQAGPIAIQLQLACHDTLRWLIFFSLGLCVFCCLK